MRTIKLGTMSHLAERWRVLLLSLLVISGFYLRLHTATMGHTWDMEMAWIVNAERYQAHGYDGVLDRGALNNYPRPWWDFLGAVASVYPPRSHEFRMAVSTAISTVDAANGVLLYIAGAGLVGAALYLLCPLTVIVAGYGAQFDGVVLFFALAGAILIRDRRLTLGALLIGIGIALKPVFVFFPAWLALRELQLRHPLNLRSLRSAAVVALGGALPGALLLGIDADRISDIYGSVVGGSKGWNMLALWYLLPTAVQEAVANPHRLTFFVLGMGAILAPRDAVVALAWYAVCFIFSIPSWHNHHLAYVVGAAAILGGWPLLVAVAIASAYELGDNNGLGMTQWRIWVPAGPSDHADHCIGNCDRRWVWEVITILLGVTIWRGLKTGFAERGKKEGES